MNAKSNLRMLQKKNRILYDSDQFLLERKSQTVALRKCSKLFNSIKLPQQITILKEILFHTFVGFH